MRSIIVRLAKNAIQAALVCLALLIAIAAFVKFVLPVVALALQTTLIPKIIALALAGLVKTAFAPMPPTILIQKIFALLRPLPARIIFMVGTARPVLNI